MVNLTLFLCDPPSHIAIATRHKLAMPLETARDDLEDDTHKSQDNEVLKIVRIEPSDLSLATLLLATIVSVSNGLLDPKYHEIPDALALIKAHPQLMQELKAAWAAQSFRKIRNLSASFN
jgi:hypothetical protein